VGTEERQRNVVVFVHIEHFDILRLMVLNGDLACRSGRLKAPLSYPGVEVIDGMNRGSKSSYCEV